ncbi:purple acid phosphatase family protein [Nocardioides jishulii]|uniref:Metallophosphoesterase family protein n=1 Tax=Nocardioides jishulii TaxID=2575440 RepID=A0A4U2YTD7_9ACTN|nr:metallophosphoesterase family protein [Nocardioides jishulii]QCX28349.1 metallophosphoesterase family protein [Nocardioides jishulii]TKI64758.1 metallophosphoesterase family protein [Nocardioides jishulii]
MSPHSTTTGRRRATAGLAAAALFAGLTTTLVGPAAASPQTLPQVVSAASVASTPVVSKNATWRYLENDTFPSEGHTDPLSWTKDGFDDATWKTGAGTFGGKISSGTQSPAYSSTHTASVQLEMNGATGERVRTYFFRTAFDLTVEQLKDLGALRGTVNLDDGAIVYLNGKEVARQDVDPGMEGLSYANVGGTGFESLPVTLLKDDLKVGRNVVAVEVHNDRASSSDIWFAMTDLLPLTAEELRPKPTRVILTPTDDPCTSQNVTFQGAVKTHTTGRVEIRPSAGGDLKSVRALLQPMSVSNDFGHFSATITGLKPATKYTYRVSSNNVWSGWHEFETADRDEKEFSYLYYGDAQVGLDSTWPSVVAQAEARVPDSIGSVHAGDLIDTSSNDTQWSNWFSGMKDSAASTNVMAAPGNHEYSGDKLMTAWKAHFEYPLNNPNDSTIGELARLAEGDSDAAKHHRAYFDHWSDFAQETVYYADYQGVRFITVNATRDSTFLRPDVIPSCSGADCVGDVADLWTRYQAAWLDHVLATSESKWKVVTFHQPVYSTSSGRNEPVLREHWVPVFQKHDIDLVQMGHDHTYARGFNNDDVTATPGLTDGPVYMVSNSGAKHYNLETDAKNVWTLNGATQVQKAQGISTYQVVDVDEDTLTVKSYIAEINDSYLKLFRDGVKLDKSQFKVGDLWDEFTVHKTDDGRKAVVEAGMDAPAFEDLTPAPVVRSDLAAETPVLPGERVVLSVEVEGAERLQWQVKPVDGEWTDVEGATSTTLKLGRVASDDLGTAYRVVATTRTRAVTSTETVLADGSAAPVLVSDLTEQVKVTSGSDVTLQVELDAATPARLQWQRRVNGEWLDLRGRTGETLVLESVRTNADYRVVASAGVHTTTSATSSVVVTKRAATVAITKVRARQGKKAVVTLRSSVDGVAEVNVKRGAKTLTKMVKVKAGKTVVVRLGTLPRKGKGKAAVTVAVTPAGVDHSAARATKKVSVRK